MSDPSISFDRAAAYYDATRGRTPEGTLAETAVLTSVLAGHGPVLEIGVGTGQIAIPVCAAGLPVIGLDLSAPMLDVLRAKAGRSPFPLILGDATRLPLADHAVGSAMFRWVLHLIPSWQEAVAELVRVVRPGGVVMALLGGSRDGPRAEIQSRFAAVAGIERRPSGLDWEDYDALDRAFDAHGASGQELPTFTDREIDTVDAFMAGLEDGAFSWTWPIGEEVRRRTAREVRAWAEAEFGPLGDLEPSTYDVRWRAYRLP